MGAGRIIAGTIMSTMLVVGGLAMPALDAREAPRAGAMSFDNIPLIGVFTPASADPRLAASLADSGMDSGKFRFTPAGATVEADDSVKAVVHTSKARGLSHNSALGAPDVDSDDASNVSLAPIAYNLGVSVGWKRLSVSGDVSKIDLASKSGSQQRVDVDTHYQGKQGSAPIKAAKSKQIDSRQQLMGDVPGYSLDVGGSYSLTRNLDITAGVRYKNDRERLPELESKSRDSSQAVYIGTSFRF